MVSRSCLRHPQFPLHECSGRTGAHQVINLAPIRRHRRSVRVAFRSNLPISIRLVEPHSALFTTHRSDKRPSIRSENDSFFFGGGRCDLVWVSIGKALAPDVETASSVRREIHPTPVGRPRRIGALAGNRPHRMAGRMFVERDQAAGQPPSRVHLGYQYGFVVGRKIGAVGHAELA